MIFTLTRAICLTHTLDTSNKKTPTSTTNRTSCKHINCFLIYTMNDYNFTSELREIDVAFAEAFKTEV